MEPAWTHWDVAAERIHGLDRARLLREGLPPAEVVRRLEAALEGMIVFSDAPDFDAGWLDALYAVVARQRTFRIEHADDILIGALRHDGEMLWQAQSRLERTKDDLRTNSVGRHDAGYDVGFLVALWRRAQGETVRMNHGSGPVPETTPTGSFKRMHA